MNSASIISLLKHEHDFINNWIEYHIKLGFSHFYLLVDNILEKQPDYIIADEYKDHVTFIHMDENDVIHFLGNTPVEIFKKNHASYIHHKLLDYKIIYTNIIKEDWLTAIGIDQYFYLNGDTIQNYLENIDETCNQIIFPWGFCCYNTNDSKFENFLENIGSYKNTYSKSKGHSNGMIRTNNLSGIQLCSHSFMSKTPRQKIFIINEYYDLVSDNDPYSIFNIVQEKLNTIPFIDIKISTFHIMLRNINETFIKNCFYWNSSPELINNIIYTLSADIKNNTKNILYLNENRINRNLDAMTEIQNDFLLNPIELKVPDLKYKNSSEHYDKLILDRLHQYNITKEEFNLWKQNLYKPLDI
jgi:putative heme iron utilization protein